MTEEQQSEQSTDLESQCAALHAESSSPTLVVKPGNAKIIYANPAFLALVKVSQSDEPIGKMSDIIGRDNHQPFKEEMVELLKERESTRQCRIELKEKLFEVTERNVTLSFLEIADDEYVEVKFEREHHTAVPEVGATAESNTPDADALARIAELEDRLIEKDTIYHHFSHIIGHELKAPLTAIKGYAELLEFDFEQKDDPETKNIISMIVKASARLYGYIEAMYRLSLQDMQTKKYKVADVQKVFEEVRTEVASIASEAGMRLTFSSSKGRLKLNPVFLREVLYQLIASEALYAKTGESTISVDWRQESGTYFFTLLHTKEALEVEMENLREKIDALEAQETGRKSTTLGYEFSKKFITQVGGKIAIERGEEGMNSFFMYIPQIG